jgi:Uma2 family endonuclease
MVATKQITVDEFETMPREGNWELIDGELFEVSPAGNRSGWISGRLFSRIEQFVRAHDLGWAFPPETGFILFGDRATVRSPDAAFVRSERMPELTDHFAAVAPDLAVEVLSPADRMADALSKVAMYLEAAVQLVWLVDPKERTVIVFRPDVSPKSRGSDDTLEGGDLLPGLTIPLAEIFE